MNINNWDFINNGNETEQEFRVKLLSYDIIEAGRPYTSFIFIRIDVERFLKFPASVLYMHPIW